MVAYLGWVVAVWCGSTRAIRASGKSMGHHAGHIQYSVCRGLEIVATVYWSVELLTVGILGLKLEWALLEGSCTTLTCHRLLRQIIPWVPVLSAALRLMQKPVLSQWLVSIMRARLLRLPHIVWVSCSDASTGQHGTRAHTDPVLTLRICIEIRIDICAWPISVSSRTWRCLNNLIWYWDLCQIGWLGQVWHIGAAAHITSRIEHQIPRFPQHLRRRMMLLVMFLYSWRLQRRRYAIRRFLCWALVLLKLINASRLWSGIREFVCRLLRIILNHLLLLHLLILLRQPLLQRSLLDIPVVHEVKVEALADKGFTKHRYELLIVGFFFEFQFPGVVEKVLEFFGVAAA